MRKIALLAIVSVISRVAQAANCFDGQQFPKSITASGGGESYYMAVALSESLRAVFAGGTTYDAALHQHAGRNQAGLVTRIDMDT